MGIHDEHPDTVEGHHLLRTEFKIPEGQNKDATIILASNMDKPQGNFGLSGILMGPNGQHLHFSDSGDSVNGNIEILRHDQYIMITANGANLHGDWNLELQPSSSGSINQTGTLSIFVNNSSSHLTTYLDDNTIDPGNSTSVNISSRFETPLYNIDVVDVLMKDPSGNISSLNIYSPQKAWYKADTGVLNDTGAYTFYITIENQGSALNLPGERLNNAQGTNSINVPYLLQTEMEILYVGEGGEEDEVDEDR